MTFITIEFYLDFEERLEKLISCVTLKYGGSKIILESKIYVCVFC